MVAQLALTWPCIYIYIDIQSDISQRPEHRALVGHLGGLAWITHLRIECSLNFISCFFAPSTTYLAPSTTQFGPVY